MPKKMKIIRHAFVDFVFASKITNGSEFALTLNIRETYCNSKVSF